MKVVPLIWPGKEFPDFATFSRYYKHSDYVVALDGAVQGPSKTEARKATIDHHLGVKDRENYPATCEQTWNIAILNDTLFQGTSLKSIPVLKVLLNDIDSDSFFSFFILKYRDKILQLIEGQRKKLHYLISCAGRLDATIAAAGSNMSTWILETLEWICEPYYDLRSSGELDQCDVKKYIAALEEMSFRVWLYIEGKGKLKKLDCDYEVLDIFTSKGKTLWLVIETGRSAKIALGRRDYISFRSVQYPDDSTAYIYTFRRGGLETGGLNIPKIVKCINAIEGKEAVVGEGIIAGNRNTPIRKIHPQTNHKEIIDGKVISYENIMDIAAKCFMV